VPAADWRMPRTTGYVTISARIGSMAFAAGGGVIPTEHGSDDSKTAA
jgi:hypothetical protein